LDVEVEHALSRLACEDKVTFLGHVFHCFGELHLFLMSSHTLHGSCGSFFSLSFPNPCLRLRLGNIKPGLCILADNLCGIVCLDSDSLLVGLSFLDDLGFVSLAPGFSKNLDILSTNDLATLSFLSSNLLLHLLRLHFDVGLQQVDFLNVSVVLLCHEHLHVVPLQLEKLLVLVVVDSKQSILLSLYLLLQEDIKVGGIHQSNSQVTRENNVHDVYLLDVDSIGSKLRL